MAALGPFVGATRSKFKPYLPPHSAASRIQLSYQAYVRRESIRNNPTRLQVTESAFSFAACSDEAPSPDVNIPGTTAAIMADFTLIVERQDAVFALLFKKYKAKFALLLGKLPVQISGH
jgi:hypothetical protein